MSLTAASMRCSASSEAKCQKLAINSLERCETAGGEWRPLGELTAAAAEDDDVVVAICLKFGMLN